MADIAADVTGRTKDVSKSGCEGGKEGFREEQVGFGDAFESKKNKIYKTTRCEQCCRCVTGQSLGCEYVRICKEGKGGGDDHS